MIQRKYETVVGIFVVASLAALLLMVVIIAQQERLWQEHAEYYAVFKNISGLKVGSEVRLAGVTVGNVKEITIDPEGQIIVTFEVLGKYRSRVRKDSRATIGYQSLLGDKSLDISAGSPGEPDIGEKGEIPVKEPFDITEMLEKAQPSLEKLQRLLNNLSELSDRLAAPGGKFEKSMEEIRQIINKINEGKGSLGLFLNDPELYRESFKTMSNFRKFSGSLEEGRGLVPFLVKDRAFRVEVAKTMANFHRVSADLQEGSSRFPEMAKKAEEFLEQLRRAGKGLPGLVTSGETMVSDVDKAAKAAQKSWLLRRHVPKAEERTIRIER
jgi:phospholipid/cholesterol/gamma-HCH transport system substrate-binding protein